MFGKEKRLRGQGVRVVRKNEGKSNARVQDETGYFCRKYFATLATFLLQYFLRFVFFFQPQKKAGYFVAYTLKLGDVIVGVVKRDNTKYGNNEPTT